MIASNKKPSQRTSAAVFVCFSHMGRACTVCGSAAPLSDRWYLWYNNADTIAKTA
ncbi:hypothetical protein HMPREF9555_01513 [Selenomonas artemidis F0399]|uniref:Uncharacterized protein n=1 Tax=Selenomonas artemidis F0399 TaxID=749551 RepID=E7N3D8_9FIRM|nr:hypothetical protein HMPREF9555_01513 [Selenomonas artemidis F0399]